MAGMEATSSRAEALRRLAARAGAGATESSVTRVAGLHDGLRGHLGLVGELLVGWIVAALITAAVVGFGAAVIPTDEPPVPIRLTDPDADTGADLDPTDPLVVCTVFVDHVRCADEPT